jgi:Macrocin-O-methyltransferase (TylF)
MREPNSPQQILRPGGWVAPMVMSPSYLPPRPPVQLLKPSLMQTIPDLFESFPNKATLFAGILQEYSGLSADPHDPVRIIMFYQLLAAANELTAGDYIELGTYGGLTLKVIHRLMDPQRTLYGLDTFEGFDPRDVAIEKTKYDYRSELEWFSRPAIENVGKYVGDGEAPANLKLVKGWFPESFKGLEGMRWRFVHIDMDLYQPIKTALQMLWASVVPGGIVVVHDYGCYSFRAARTAVNEFCDSIGVSPVEMPDRWGSAVLRKPFANECANQKHDEQLKNLRLEIERKREEAQNQARAHADADEAWRKHIARERDHAAIALHRVTDEANDPRRARKFLGKLLRGMGLR